jgi:hypothetical protein
MLRRIALALAVSAFGGLASADVIISNLDGNDGTQSADLNASRVKGMGFTMPSGADYFLDDATLRLETFGSNVRPIVEVWSDSNGVPGTMLTRLDNPSFNASGVSNYAFTPGGQFVLQASTTYWIVAYGESGASRYDWKGSSPGQQPTGLATHAGATFGTSGPPPTGSSSILNSYAINGTLVPAPGAMALLGLWGLAAVGRRR